MVPRVMIVSRAIVVVSSLMPPRRRGPTPAPGPAAAPSTVAPSDVLRVVITPRGGGPPAVPVAAANIAPAARQAKPPLVPRVVVTRATTTSTSSSFSSSSPTLVRWPPLPAAAAVMLRRRRLLESVIPLPARHLRFIYDGAAPPGGDGCCGRDRAQTFFFKLRCQQVASLHSRGWFFRSFSLELGFMLCYVARGRRAQMQCRGMMGRSCGFFTFLSRRPRVHVPRTRLLFAFTSCHQVIASLASGDAMEKLHSHGYTFRGSTRKSIAPRHTLCE